MRFFFFCHLTIRVKDGCKPDAEELIQVSFVSSADGATGELPVVTGAFVVG